MPDAHDTTEGIKATLCRIEQFLPYANPDGTWHVLAVDANGGFIFADALQAEHAIWTSELLNAAQLGIRMPGALNELADLHDIVRKLNMRLSQVERDR